MPIYEYENTKTGERFTENLPIHKRNFPCRNSFIRRVISAPKISIISDMGGKEDKAREQIDKTLRATKIGSATRSYVETLKEKANIKMYF